MGLSLSEHTRLRRAERIARAVARLEAALDHRPGLNLDRRLRRNPRRSFAAALRVVRAKLTEAGRW